MNAFLESLCFHNPFAKRFCASCGSLCGAGDERCPHCREPLADDCGYYHGLRNIPDVSPWRQLALAFGYLYLQIIALMISIIAATAKTASLASQYPDYTEDQLLTALEEWTAGADYLAIVNYVTYVILFGLLLLILWRECSKVFAAFKNPKAYWGFALGFGLIAVSVLWSLFLNAVCQDLPESENQTAVIKMVKNAPVFAVLITGIIGPFAEELIYRVGIFGFLRRINVYIAYIFGAAIFGMIHLQDRTSAYEWINFTSYLVSGLYLAFVYEKFGFGASFFAHVTNNLVSVIQILLLSQ